MLAKVEQFLERPTSHKVAFWIGALILISFLFWYLIFSTKVTELKTLQEDVTRLETERANEIRLSRNLSRFREEVKELDYKLKIALQELPEKKEIPDLLSSISTLATEAGLEISLFRPRSEEVREFYAEVPVEIAVTGSYHEVATFFDEVGQLPRIVNIDKIALGDPKIEDARITLKTSCMATTFRYLDEAERAAQQKAAETKKR